MPPKRKPAEVPNQSVKAESEESTTFSASEKRISLYLTDEILVDFLKVIEEDDSNKNAWITSLLKILITSPQGRNLRKAAYNSNRSLLELLRDYMDVFGEDIPVDKITELAKSSRRNPGQMIAYLLMLGLKTYEEYPVEPNLSQQLIKK